MYGRQYVLLLVPLYVGFAHSWDVAVSRGQNISFYNEDNTLIDTVSFNAHSPAGLDYDEVHDMMLFVDKKQLNNDAICVYDIINKETTCLTERNGRNIHGIAYDPATSLIYFTDVNERSINFVSINARGSIHGNLLLKNDHGIPTEIVVESCRGHIFWINIGIKPPTIERAYIDGSARQVIVNLYTHDISGDNKAEPHSLSIDQQTQRLYWIEYFCIYYSDWNGNDKTCLTFRHGFLVPFGYPKSNTLSVSKTFLYLGDRGDERVQLMKFNKIERDGVDNNLVFQTYGPLVKIDGQVARYNIKERIQCIKECIALTYIHAYERKNSCDGSFCVHGTKVLGQALCTCPTGYKGERCDVSVCDTYCLRGTCTVNDEGHPTCRCDAGYSGDRCEVNDCHVLCLNDGVCSLNGAAEAFCDCVSGFEGPRCEVNQSRGTNVGSDHTNKVPI